MALPEAPPALELPHVVSEFDAAASLKIGKSLSVIRPRCAGDKADEIVVCATDPKRNRLGEPPNSPPDGPSKTEARLSDNATIDLHVEAAQISGAPSNRLMVGVKIGF